MWVKIAESYNDMTFNILTNRYPQVHSDFDRAIDISYDAVVPSIGKMTVEKAKSKFMDMKNQAFIIKAKSEESGGGDGSREADQDDFVVDDGEIQVGGSDIAKRLGGIGTHVAYFYKFMEENGLKAVAYQQLWVVTLDSPLTN